MRKRQIKWIKFVDYLQHAQGFNPEDEEEIVDGEEWQYNEDNPDDKPGTYTPFRVAKSSSGMFVTIPENSMASKHFDFWDLHTNFNIGEKVATAIINTDGVETFNIITRYRARVGFSVSGLWDIDDVKKQIEENIMSLFIPKPHVLRNSPRAFEPKVAEKINKKKEELTQTWPHWALYILPNGEMEVVTAESNSDVFKSKVDNLRNTSALVGGALHTSED